MLTKTLNSIQVGETATVSGVYTNRRLQKRLLDLGLIPGTEVQCLGRSPSGDPTAYLIRGAVIALRCEDCKNITLNN